MHGVDVVEHPAGLTRRDVQGEAALRRAEHRGRAARVERQRLRLVAGDEVQAAERHRDLVVRPALDRRARELRERLRELVALVLERVDVEAGDAAALDRLVDAGPGSSRSC